MTNFTLRKATRNDEQALATLAYNTYYRRFFCLKTLGRDGKPYGGPLGKEFPELLKGQTQESFEDYWAKFIPGVFSPNPTDANYCFVAENGRGQIIGFVKGNGKPVDSASADQAQTSSASTAELGSLYINFDYQQSFAGRLLTQVYARQMACLGYKALVTRAYDKNDSVFFFQKMGATNRGRCLHP